ncbi:MAG: thiamine pyrophosphate-binding protein, partial [Acidobacteriota bacterium]
MFSVKRSGAEIFVECLVRQNVGVVFGHPGGVVLPIYDRLYGSPVRHILVRHEQAAVHAADGYARASGRAGVCLVTSGPGATNIVTGLVNAQMDSIPVVAFTGQVSQALIG